MASGEMDRPEFTAFLGEAFGNLAAFSEDGSIHFVCMDWRHVEELLAAGREAYDELKNICVWVKDNAGMGSFYRSQHELVFVFKHGRNGHRNNVQLGQFGRNRSNVWHYPGANCTFRRSRWLFSTTAELTIRGGGNPYSNLALDADREKGPAARSFAADAHDCIMVRIKQSYRIQILCSGTTNSGKSTSPTTEPTERSMDHPTTLSVPDR